MNDERWDEELDSPSEDEQEQVHKGSSRFARVITVLVTATLIVMAALVFLYRDQLSSQGLQRLLGGGSPSGDSYAPYSYENGTSQCFAAAGDGFAVASSSGIQLLDSKGATVVREVCSMDDPALAASGAAAVFFDVGGDTCKLATFDGTVRDIDAGESILSASVNDSGYFAVISEESGSKGLVQVFDKEGELLYQWFSGSGYPLRAQVSPDSRHLAVLCLTEEGSALHLFKLSSEDEQATLHYPGQLLYDLSYMSSDRLCLLGSEGMAFAKSDGSAVSEFDFGGLYLAAYDFGGSGFAAVYLSEYRAGAGGTLVTLDSDGTELGRTALDGDLISLSARGRQVLFAASDGLELYSQALQLIESDRELVTAKHAILRPKGDVLLLSSFAAEPFDF